MVYKEHLIELWVNGNKVELESQKSINMRFNNVLYDPTKISSTQAEYSFEFEIPSTPKNDVIFDYANNLSKLNKFHQRYKAEVYADGTVIFAGTITLNDYKDKKYSVNLVSVKVYSLEDIFGDKTMNQIKGWEIDFNGIETMNQMNASGNSEVMFPLISYGAFQKSPYNSDEVANDYTSKYDMDEWNRWYVEDFYPSHNMMATLKKAFEGGTNNGVSYSVFGDAFLNPYLKNIFMSVNLADGQDPEYNVGNPRFGFTDLDTSLRTAGSGYEQELQFPYFKVNVVGYSGEQHMITSTTEYNFPSVRIYDLFGSGATKTLNNQPNYMYQPEEGLIVVPANGFYKIEMSVNSTLNTTGTIRAMQYVVDPVEREVRSDDYDLPVGLDEMTPLEIALVRNYDDNYELIKGKNNKNYTIGNPLEYDYYISGRRYINPNEWETCFPHEDPYSSELPTKENDLKTKNKQGYLGGRRSDTSSGSNSYGASNSDTSASGNFSGRRGGTRGGTIDRSGGGRYYSPLTYGYINNDGEIMAYDQAVSTAFICGFSSLLGGTVSVMKNGYSWSSINSSKNEAFYKENGYTLLKREEGTGTLIYEPSRYNENTYLNAPTSYCNTTPTSMNGYVSCIVWLNKNDKLRLLAVQRAYNTENGSETNYSTTSNVSLKIRAFSPYTYYYLKSKNYNDYNITTQFNDKLNLANFFNREKKISEWVQNILDAYNLELLQFGNTITISTKKKLEDSAIAAVDIDNRVNSTEAESKVIDYPKSMTVKYKIDADEWGFEQSAEAVINSSDSIEDKDAVINDEDAWKAYGDSGYTTIYLNDDTYVTSTSDKSLQFSYSWYQNFNWYPTTSGYTKESDNTVILKMPCISKYEYMIDGYNYDESMKHDGYGLAQRFWYKPIAANGTFVWTRTYPPEKMMIYTPSNIYNGLNLSYKSTERSLLNEFFNIKAYLSTNYVEVDVYLSAEEYNRIKSGSLVHFDSDLYYPVEISGYDPSGYNPTTLKLMKKVN